MTTQSGDDRWSSVECRQPDCGARAPGPVSSRDGAAWMESHGREAHGDPYLGARWGTSARETREARPARKGRSR